MSQPLKLAQSGQLEAAIAKLKPNAEKEGIDQVLYLLELGSAQQIKGLHQDAIATFLKAERLMELKDYHSISQIGVAALGSEEMIQYKGENYEKLMVNVKLALSYLVIGDLENAMVQARRIDQKINTLRLNGRPDFERNPFALYLAGLLFEASGEYDNALILYQQAYELDPTMALLEESIVGAAQWLRRDDVIEKWKKKGVSPDWLTKVRDKNFGELIVITPVGWGPRKHFSSVDYRFPELRESRSETTQVRVSIKSDNSVSQSIATLTAYDVSRAAIQTYKADVAWMIARKVGAHVAKKAVVNELNKSDNALALVAGLAMTVADRADLRCWTFLPKEIQIQRLRLPKGDYNIDLEGTSFSGSTGERQDNQPLTIKPGKKSFIFWRPLK